MFFILFDVYVRLKKSLVIRTHTELNKMVRLLNKH